jgi:hypothetical protein
MKIENFMDVTAWFANVSHELNCAFVIAGWMLSRAQWSDGDLIPIDLVNSDAFGILKDHGFLKEKCRCPSGIRDYFFICDDIGRYLMDSHNGDFQWDEPDSLCRYPALIGFLNKTFANYDGTVLSSLTRK